MEFGSLNFHIEWSYLTINKSHFGKKVAVALHDRYVGEFLLQ